MAFQQYLNKSGKGGISRYEIGEEAILLEFKENLSQYLYTYKNPGKVHVEEMKKLARQGRGLTTYVNQHVREKYQERIK